MRGLVLAFVVLGAVICTTRNARADDTTPCGAVLCLAGLALGQDGGSSCAGYISAYFSIVVIKGGVFKGGDTLSERLDFLNECSTADSATIASDNAAFGAQEFEP